MIPWLAWLLGAGVGPADVGLPVNWAADALAGAAKGWFRRLRRTDDLSRLVRTATGTSVHLTDAEFDAVRRLLEDQQTWAMLAHGTVEDLTTRIASCLPPRDGRTSDDSYAAAATIARGLLEFAVADLEPKVFQQLLLARLQRMETGQASALDDALLGLHADLVARLDAQGKLDAQHFTSLMRRIKQALDRLPPGPAQWGEIVAYLQTLRDWLNTDPWPRDRRFDGPMLTPAAIERKLRVTAMGRAGERDLDADDLAQQCERLVILGGPGSGKTWLAKRTARRCAEDALEALAAGGNLDEVELPLYTSCSRLFGAHGDIRQAVVSSALDQLGDLGGSRLTAAVREFFTERNAPTVLLIDSLDEAYGPDERLRQADTLPWRIVLTTRPSSWNHLLDIKEEDDSYRVCELQPLRYPPDVEPFIHQWFARRPEWGRDLAAQIARRPDLQAVVVDAEHRGRLRDLGRRHRPGHQFVLGQSVIQRNRLTGPKARRQCLAVASPAVGEHKGEHRPEVPALRCPHARVQRRGGGHGRDDTVQHRRRGQLQRRGLRRGEPRRRRPRRPRRHPSGGRAEAPPRTRAACPA